MYNEPGLKLVDCEITTEGDRKDQIIGTRPELPYLQALALRAMRETRLVS